jgi:2-C-methyl-D-erythritol 4-phosphate cytidylyltransferase
MLIRDGLKAAQEIGAAIAAVPVKDTIKLGTDDCLVVETLARERLWLVQTPQVFRCDIIDRAHEQIRDNVTDDASMVERLGYEVKLYMGSYNNIKITTPEDIIYAEAIARAEQGA